jgi:hypothetical protein
MAIFRKRGRDSSDSIVSGYGRDGRTIEVLSPAETKRIFPLASVSRLALRPTQPPVQWVPERGPFLGVSATGAWRWPITPIYFRGHEWVGAVPPLPPAPAIDVLWYCLTFVFRIRMMSFIPFLSYLLCYNFDYPRVKEFECWSQW